MAAGSRRGPADPRGAARRGAAALIAAAPSTGCRSASARCAASREAASGQRRLRQIDLWEISIVTFPLLARARIAPGPRAAAAASARLACASLRRPQSPLSGQPSIATHARNIPTEDESMTEATEDFEIKAAPARLPARSPTVRRAHGRLRGVQGSQRRSGSARSSGAAPPTCSPRTSSAGSTPRSTAPSGARPGEPGAGPAAARRRRRRGPCGGDEHKAAFSAYVKRGEEKALSVGSDPDGGYLVPTETETEINRC